MLLALAGSTASGKTELALQLAEALGGQILCADSRQLYRELNIGTAKPTAEEFARVPHQLFDLADPRETFTVAQYARAAEACLQQLWQNGQTPLLVGGTGLYFRTLLYDYQLPAVPPQAELRLALAEQEVQAPGSLYQRLQSVDPICAMRLHAHDLRRVIRALEVFEVTGQPISASQTRSDSLRYPGLYLGLQVPKAQLYPRIQRRIENMVQMGLVEEVEQLRATYGPDLPLLKTLNYIEIAGFLDGKWNLETAKEQMFIHTRQYAKRQLTWFRRDAEIQWYTLTQPQDLQAMATDILRKWSQLKALTHA